MQDKALTARSKPHLAGSRLCVHPWLHLPDYMANPRALKRTQKANKSFGRSRLLKHSRLLDSAGKAALNPPWAQENECFVGRGVNC